MIIRYRLIVASETIKKFRKTPFCENVHAEYSVCATSLMLNFFIFLPFGSLIFEVVLIIAEILSLTVFDMVCFFDFSSFK